MNHRSLSRRTFLKATGMAGVGLALAACAPAAPGGAPAADSGVTSEEVTQVLFWYNAENHKDEYDARVNEINETFGVEFTTELLGGDSQTKKFQATMMAGEGFPDIIEQNAGESVKFLKGTDEQIPFVAMNDFLDESGY